MHLLDYKAFSALRFTDFLAPGTPIFSSSGIECCSSHCAEYYEMVGEAIFVFADAQGNQLVEVSVEDSDSFAESIVSTIGLPLRWGMTLEHVVAAIGQPEYSAQQFSRYAVGDECKYRIGCGISPSKGLWSVFIVRNDFFLEDD